jgi:hypothetical protein
MAPRACDGSWDRPVKKAREERRIHLGKRARRIREFLPNRVPALRIVNCRGRIIHQLLHRVVSRPMCQILGKNKQPDQVVASPLVRFSRRLRVERPGGPVVDPRSRSLAGEAEDAQRPPAAARGHRSHSVLAILSMNPRIPPSPTQSRIHAIPA